MSMNLNFNPVGAYKVTPKATLAAPNVMAPVPAPAPAPVAPEQGKPWWQKIGEGIGKLAFGALEVVVSPGIAFGTAVFTGVPGGVKTGIEAGTAGAQTAWSGLTELGGAFSSDPAPMPADEPAASEQPIEMTPYKVTPRADEPLDPDAVDINNTAAINNFLWQASKQLLGRKPKMSEVGWWRDQIQLHGKTPREVMTMIQNMPEGTMNSAAQKALGRNLTDTERTMFVLDFRNDTKSLGDIVNKIYDAASHVMSADLGDQATVDRLNHEARMALCRDLSAAELAILEKHPTSLNAVVEAMREADRDTMAEPVEQPAAVVYHQGAF
ncbi:MAG: hypothetical protein JWM80_4430 [Cyanobacteria bacterium RYN_339]|nr:hypothetical protein [Cyanobacteria bacterium RYN_339]